MVSDSADGDVSEIVGVISFIREKFAPNMLTIMEYVRNKVVIHVSSNLLRQYAWGVGCVQAGPDSTSDRCFETFLVAVSRVGKTPSRRLIIQQPGEDDDLVETSQQFVAHAMVTQRFQRV